MYWWEFIVMLRKLAVLVVAVLLRDPWYQLMGAVLVVVTALLLQTQFHPFDAQLFNLLETVTLTALFLTQIISLMCVSPLFISQFPLPLPHLSLLHCASCPTVTSFASAAGTSARIHWPRRRVNPWPRPPTRSPRSFFCY